MKSSSYIDLQIPVSVQNPTNLSILEDAMNNKFLPEVKLLESPDWKDYVLLDSGGGRKLERFGRYILIRPEAEAMWSPLLPETEWHKASAEFKPSPEENGGHWIFYEKDIHPWNIGYKNLKFQLMLSNSKQVGVFPEQACQWDWVSSLIRNSEKPVKVLNLFGYTGAITMAAAEAGAEITHLDASKKAVDWAKENQKLSSLEQTPIRWIIDDGLKFVQREARRGSFYQGIILDPPKFGRGPKGEVWEFYKNFPELIQACRNILDSEALFLLVTAYAVKASSVTVYNTVNEVMKGMGGSVSAGEVCLKDKSGGRLLSMAVYSRWQKEG